MFALKPKLIILMKRNVVLYIFYLFCSVIIKNDSIDGLHATIPNNKFNVNFHMNELFIMDFK